MCIAYYIYDISFYICFINIFIGGFMVSAIAVYQKFGLWNELDPIEWSREHIQLLWKKKIVHDESFLFSQFEM